MMNQLQWLGLVASYLLVLGAGPVWAQGKGVQNQENLATSAQRVAAQGNAYGGLRLRELLKEVNHNIPIQDKVGSREQTQSRIRQLSEVEHPSTSAKMLVQSPTPSNSTDQREDRESEVIQITSVKANPTSKGVEVILETPVGTQLQVTNRSAGSNFIVDIFGGQLRLPSGEAFTFRSEKPLAEITEITAQNIDANTVRVTVVGEKALPTVELYDDDAGLVFAVATTATATSPQQPTQQPQTQQPENQTQPTQPSASGDEPIELVVTGEQDNYRATDSSTATRTDTPLRDIPQSIQVIPQQVLRDQQATTIQEALRNVSGASLSNIPGFQSNDFVLRGFTGNYLRNGLPDYNAAFAADLANVERLDVLKGPASVLFGVGTPGATINLITKKPLRDPFYAIDATVGNYNTYRGAIDLSGPLNDSKTVLYRLNAVYQDTGSFVDFLSTKNYSIAPVIGLMLGTKTKLTIEGEYRHTHIDSFYLGLPALGTVLPNPNGKIPINRNTAEPNYFRDFTIGSISYDLEHQFSDNWSLRNAFQASFSSVDSLRSSGNDLLDDNRTVDRDLFTEDYNQYSYALITNVIGKILTGSIQHQLLFGVDLNRSGYPNYRAGNGGLAALLDIYNPVYGQPPRVLESSRNRLSNLTDSLGVYLQDQVTIAENLKLLLGGRFDLFTQTNGSAFADQPFKELSQGGDAFSPRVGIVYQPIPAISLYGSYTRSFTPNFGRSADNRLFDPEGGRQYEVGVKADLSPTLSTTLALYDLERSNVLTTDPNDDRFSILTGEQRSRGIELNLTGEILPGWNIYAGYAYTDARITKDNSYRVGSRLFATPENAVNLWTTYEFQRGGLKGFGAGLGLFYVGEREGDLENDFQLPDYLRTDVALFYKRDQLRLQLNIRNLFDINYFETSAGQTTRVIPGSPFTVEGRISWEF
ncbi:MAG: TonB-dependent siderophore receptor [Nostoc sp.]|uniref:TonB-dependent siderophore receptor n=1 Tax=Nostoc sp. TaxID=1180 RepID=UPI002FF25BF3